MGDPSIYVAHKLSHLLRSVYADDIKFPPKPCVEKPIRWTSRSTTNRLLLVQTWTVIDPIGMPRRGGSNSGFGNHTISSLLGGQPGIERRPGGGGSALPGGPKPTIGGQLGCPPRGQQRTSLRGAFALKRRCAAGKPKLQCGLTSQFRPLTE